ncbi:hypothetical protein [Actinoplanes awajinensis]|nr:hypothetical protein [Actinoplanes awajinensis]
MTMDDGTDLSWTVPVDERPAELEVTAARRLTAEERQRYSLPPAVAA